MSDLLDLEAEAAATRARLQDTIGRIQDKLTLSGMVDDFMGQTGVPKLEDSQNYVYAYLRRNPLPLLLAAAGIGFFIHRRNRRRPLPSLGAEPDVAVLNDGQARLYDPDLPSRHPRHEGSDGRRIDA